jgi:hypothetical protein
MIGALILYFALTYPLFSWMYANPSFGSLIVTQVALCSLLGVFFGPTPIVAISAFAEVIAIATATVVKTARRIDLCLRFPTSNKNVITLTRSGPWEKTWIKVKNPKAPAATRAMDGTF